MDLDVIKSDGRKLSYLCYPNLQVETFYMSASDNLSNAPMSKLFQYFINCSIIFSSINTFHFSIFLLFVIVVLKYYI